MKSRLRHIATICLSLMTLSLSSQSLSSLDIKTTNDKGLLIKSFNGFQQPGYDMPLLSLRINGDLFSSLQAERYSENEALIDKRLMIKVEDIKPLKSGGFSLKASFYNTSKDTLIISNIVPFGESEKHVYLTSWNKGDRLSRAFIFRPGYSPVNVTLPDNAWELGLGIVNVDNGSSVVGIMRINKQHSAGVMPKRFESLIYPGGKLVSTIWMDSYIGRWQEGFRLMFQQNMLYDLEPGTFDNKMYEREDLKWVRNGFVGHFIWAWHNYLYDGDLQLYTYEAFREQAKKYYGGDDNIILWTGFPVLGLDQRNQWDLTRAMPGGVKKLREISDRGLKEGMHLMTNYKPWDLPAAFGQIYNSTRYEHPIEGLGKISQEAGFCGVMFDTRSESSIWFQDGIDQYKKGFAVFPEGMCVPVNMQNCLLGRIHAAIEYAPFLNLNRLIKPDFTIYRQIVVEKEYTRRDVALSFFNGHGVEYHQYMNLGLDWVKDLYSFTGRTMKILRESNKNLLSYNWTPLIPTTVDSIYVNEWPTKDKTLYTIYSLIPRGYNGSLFEVPVEDGWHFVDLWNNREIRPKRLGSKYLIDVNIDPFPAEYLGTRSESSVSAIARFRQLIKVNIKDKKINILSPVGKQIKVWQGHPAYEKVPVLETSSGTLNLNESDIRKNYDGDLVIQLFNDNDLIDQYTIEGNEENQSKRADVLFSKSDAKTSYNSSYMDVVLLREKDLLNITQNKGSEIIVYPKDMKSCEPKMYKDKDISINLLDTFGRYEGDFVVLVKDGGAVVDSTNVNMPYGYPRLASRVEKSSNSLSDTENMVRVPAGSFVFKAKHIGDWTTKYPMEDTAKVFRMQSFYIDKHLVTNKEFKRFLDESGYKPGDAENFLKHWDGNVIPEGDDYKPVTFISYEDAKAYANWIGKRLPTEKEWQYAAMSDKGFLYPWGNQMDSTKCNTGNGILDPVGTYPQGANSFGIEDLTGSVWQLTNDLYKNATTSYIILKGGSYFTPKSSWWYVEGGALPLINRQQLFRVSQGYERCATVGFRLVKDVGN